MTSHWKDQPDRYGRLSRLLHWGMACIFLWQFAGMVVKLTVGRSPLTAFWVGTHVSVGTVLWLLIVLRVLWAVSQMKRRPSQSSGWKGRAARAGHGALYVLMVVVPSLAVLRQWGSGKGYAVFGIPIVAPTGQPIAWMVEPARMLHGTLAWTLLALVVGHIAMVLVHRFVWQDRTTDRMLG